MTLEIIHAETDWSMVYLMAMYDLAAEKRPKPGQAVLFMNKAGRRVKLVLHDGTVIDKRRDADEAAWDADQIRAHFKKVLSLTVTVTKVKDQKAVNRVADTERVEQDEAA